MVASRLFLFATLGGGRSLSVTSPATCWRGAELCDDTEVLTDVVLSAGDADRGLDEADPADVADAVEPDADRDCGGGNRQSVDKRGTLSMRCWPYTLAAPAMTDCPCSGSAYSDCWEGVCGREPDGGAYWDCGGCWAHIARI